MFTTEDVLCLMSLEFQKAPEHAIHSYITGTVERMVETYTWKGTFVSPLSPKISVLESWGRPDGWWKLEISHYQGDVRKDHKLTVALEVTMGWCIAERPAVKELGDGKIVMD